MPGILYNGTLYQVPGVTVLSPGDRPWVKMSTHDYAPRETTWIRQITIHTTQGKIANIKPGVGPGRGDERTATAWFENPEPGGAPIVIGADGEVVCLIDIGKSAAFHATTVNPWSVGIEIVQDPNGTIYEVELEVCTKIVLFLCDLLGIPFQGSGRVYHENGILQRMLHGGRDVVGVFGHRDNAWQFPEWMTPAQRLQYPNGTSSRGRGDPGDEIFVHLNAAGKMNFDIDAKEELAFWKNIQDVLNRVHGTQLTVDGVCGPGTVAALRKYNLWNGGKISTLWNGRKISTLMSQSIG